MKKALCIAVFITLLLFSARGAGSEEYPHVDLLLVLAIDISGSMTDERFEVERDGYAAAFGSEEVIRAATGGPIGAIAVTVVQWSDLKERYHVIDWRLIHDEASSRAFAAELAFMERSTLYGSTHLAGALLYSAGLIENAPYHTTRKVIDISGDESGYAAVDLPSTRTLIVEKGIVINGLPILGYEENIDLYFQNQVIGGDEAFVSVVDNPHDRAAFAEAIKKKLVQEIAVARK